MDEAVKAQIRQLLAEDVPPELIARRLGVSRGTVSAVKAHITMGTYQRGSSEGGCLSGADVDEIEDATDLKFGLERDMQEALRRNIHQLDPAFRIVDDGKERTVEAGRIDLLAEDSSGSLVVIELKSGEVPDTAITQVLSYVASLQAEERDRSVRGMLIGRSFPNRVRLAARAAGIRLVSYGYSFSFTDVGHAGEESGGSTES